MKNIIWRGNHEQEDKTLEGKQGIPSHNFPHNKVCSRIRKFKFKIIATFDDYYKKNFSASNETDLQPFVPSARSSKFPRLEPALSLHDQIFRLLLFRQGLLSSIESEHKD